MAELCRCPKCNFIHPIHQVSEESSSILKSRVAIFIDGGNLYHTAKKLNFKVDFLRLRDFFIPEDSELFQAYYYTAFDSTQGFIMRILDYLRYNNFIVVTKHVKKFPMMMKGNLDVELVIDMITNLDHFDTAILISGDGDFTRCVEELQKHGKKVQVVSTEKTVPPLLAQELKNQADVFIELEEIIPFVEQEL